MPIKSAKWRVLFDLNMILDVLLRRESFFTDAARIWALAETDQIEGFVAAHSFTTLFYLYRHQVDHQSAYQAIRNMLRVFDVAGVDRMVIEKACDLGWHDFEDAVQSMAARGATCDYLVTRNPEDYQERNLTIILPADFLAVWVSNQFGDS
jgi:predicted nucleic acid-binding protein